MLFFNRVALRVVIAVGGLGASLATADTPVPPGVTPDKPEDGQDVKPAPAPAGSTPLFNGKDLSDWTNLAGNGPASWKVADGAMQVVPGTGDICSRQQFSGDFKLHVEFAIPYEPDRHGGSRGNSGVYLQGRYEVQILDNYHNVYQDPQGVCGAIYSIAAPTRSVPKAPTIWQSYDIEFHSPKCENQAKKEPGWMTVTWNGVKVHDHVELTKDNTPSGRGGDPCSPGPIMLQDHGSATRFRNVWIEAIKPTH